MDENEQDIELKKFANDMIRKDIVFPVISTEKDFPLFISHLDTQIGELFRKKEILLPNLKNAKSIAVFSDYSGEHTTAKYITYSFLVSEYDSLGMFESEMDNIRKKYKLDEPYKEIAFKDLHYGPLKRAVNEILKGADTLINGLLFTLIVDKQLMSVFGPSSKETLNDILGKLENNDLNHWKPEVTEKVLRIIHTIGYLISLLAFEGQKLFWMTDNDSIIQTTEQRDNIGRLLQSVLDYYTHNSFISKVGYATPFEDVGFIDFKHYLGLSDLVAGCISDYYIHTDNDNNPEVSNESVAEIIEWLCHDGLLLKKINFKIDSVDNDHIETGFVKFELLEPRQNNKVINIDW